MNEVEQVARRERRRTGLFVCEEEEEHDTIVLEQLQQEKRGREAPSPRSLLSPSSPPSRRQRRSSDPPSGIAVDEFGLPFPSPSRTHRVIPWASNLRALIQDEDEDDPERPVIPELPQPATDSLYIELSPPLRRREAATAPPSDDNTDNLEFSELGGVPLEVTAGTSRLIRSGETDTRTG